MSSREKVKEILIQVKQILLSDISNINTASLIVGALVALIISAAVGPVVTGWVAHTANDYGVPPYEGPSPSFVLLGGTGEYTVPGEDLEEFDGAEYNSSVRVYQVQIKNPAQRPIENVDIHVPLPGCVVSANVGGFGTNPRMVDYVSLDLKGQSEGVDSYKCSKTITVNELAPGDSAQVTFLLRTSFNKCDLLQGVGKQDQMKVDYQWAKNGIRFHETDSIDMDREEEFESAFRDVRKTGVEGKRILVDGNIYSSYIMKENATSIADGMGECRLLNG